MLALLLDDHLKEEACMKYINARNILPDALVKELQSYMQGGYLYIPANQAQKKRWGEASGYLALPLVMEQLLELALL